MFFFYLEAKKDLIIFTIQVTTGAYDDLKKAYDIASAMVIKLGMSEKVGYIGFEDIEYTKKYSEETQKVIFTLEALLILN